MNPLERLAAAPRVGTLPAGPRDHISDVEGVTVGHLTLDDGPLQTGVTVIRPQVADAYLHKLSAGFAVFNGFGKSIGLMQVAELGVIETPIALTNTFGVGTVANGMIRSALDRHPKIGREWPTVNPLVFECNDGYLNDIRAMAVTASHYTQALDAPATCGQGAVGAGRGMSCFGLKGGIGSASCEVTVMGDAYRVGVMVLANFGRPGALLLAGRRVGPALVARLDADSTVAAPGAEKGSIIMIAATDAPLDARQLTRIARRCGAGLARTGSDYGHGSGDVALAFSTRPRPARGQGDAMSVIEDEALDGLFQATAQATEQAIVHALFCAVTVSGRDGHVRRALLDIAPDWARLAAG